ncbi:MAG: FapA family protein [Firmicutes bacterium]|nr:FapA family protein [Bacillota bacterium]
MGNKEVVIQGKTVKDACLTARKILQAEEKHLQIEVLDEGSRGLLGLWWRPATIRAILRPEHTSGRRDRDAEADREGMAEVIGGVLRVHGPHGTGQAAMVIPTPGAVLRVNGIVVHGPRQIREDEEVDVEPVEEVRPAGVEVEVSADGFTARAKVTPQVTVRHELVDQNPQSVLQLFTQHHEERIKVIAAADVEAALWTKGVTFGLNREEILLAVETADGVPRVVARGDPVREGQDGFIEYLFDREPVEIVYGDEEKVNYWERYVFPSVKEGELLAVLHEPVPGVPGRKVTGEIVLPRPTREVSLRVKDGVVIDDGGRKAVAAIAGRPVVEGYRERYLKVVQMMVHPTDVDMKSGNLSFRGDLLILGNVNEGMRVVAHGDITVMGNSSGAVIQAGGMVICRGSLIGCQVRAGGLKLLYNRLAPLLNSLDQILEQIARETNRIRQHPVYSDKLKKTDVSRIVRFLLEKKRQEINAIVTEYATALEKIDLPFPAVFRELPLSIKNLVLGPAGREESSTDELQRMLEKKVEIDHLLDSLPDQPGDILCSYAQNSVLDATGSIVVADQGCYHSVLTAGKRVKINGVFRGGEISALGDVYIDEAGSPGFSTRKTARIKVAEEAVVGIRKVFPETTVQVGNRSFVFYEERNRVRLYVGPNGTLKIGTLGNDEKHPGGDHRVVAGDN